MHQTPSLFPEIPPVFRHSSFAKAACVGLLLSAFFGAQERAQAQTSSYLMNTELSDYSGMTANGGTVVVPYEIFSGDAPPGVGNSFNVTFTVSPITSYIDGNSYQWNNLVPPPELGLIGGLYPANIFEGLPTSNQNALAVNAGSVVLDPGYNSRLWMEDHLLQGNLEFLGEFTVTIGALPTLPPGYFAPLQINPMSELHSFLIDGSNVLAGVWATPSPPLESSNIENGTQLAPFDHTVTYRFTAFSNGPVLPTGPDLLMWNGGGIVQFDVVPEPSSLLLLAAGAFVLGSARRRGRKAAA